MSNDRQFQFKKAQIENFLKSEFKKKFRHRSKISIRKRQKFLESVTRKVSQRFGKDVLCLIDFTKNGFISVVSPSQSEPTSKGRLFQSFSHPQVYYTSHCVDRFAQRTETTENCILILDTYLQNALLTYGLHPGHLVCPDGLFAYELEEDRFIIKTYINYELLSDSQIREFYVPDVQSLFAENMVTENFHESDFILSDEYPHLTNQS